MGFEDETVGCCAPTSHEAAARSAASAPSTAREGLWLSARSDGSKSAWTAAACTVRGRWDGTEAGAAATDAAPAICSRERASCRAKAPPAALSCEKVPL
eukprot:scaffold28336_cov51-Isochrysis_galbana.AAC.1